MAKKMKSKKNELKTYQPLEFVVKFPQSISRQLGILDVSLIEPAVIQSLRAGHSLGWDFFQQLADEILRIVRE